MDGISVFASLVNAPLMFSPARDYVSHHASKQFEDAEVIEKVLKGEWVPGKSS